VQTTDFVRVNKIINSGKIKKETFFLNITKTKNHYL